MSNEPDDLVEDREQLLDDIRALEQLGLVEVEHGDDGRVRIGVTALGREECVDGD